MDVKLTAILSAKVDAFIDGINQATTKLQTFGKQADKIGQGLSFAVSLPLGIIGKKALEAAGDFDALRRGLATVEKDAFTLQKRLVTLAEIAKLPGLGLKESFKTDLSLRTTLGPLVGYEKAVNLATRAIVAFGNANASVGGGKEDFGAAMLQMQQIVSQGKIQGDELNVLASRIPQVRTAIIAAFGTANTEMINSRNNAAQIVEKITAELEKLPKASGGIKNAFENMSDFMSLALDRIGTNIARNFDLNAIIDAITGAIDKLINKFESLSPTVQKIITVLGGIAIVIPPIIAAIGLIAPAISAGIGVIAALNAPILAVAAIVGIAAAAIIKHWDSVKSTLVDSGAWQTMSRIISSALSGVISVFAVFKNLIEGDWENLFIHLKNVVYSAANGIIQIWADLMTGILNIGEFLLPGDSFKPAKDAIKWFADEANKAIIPVNDLKKATSSLFEGFNFGGEPKILKLANSAAKAAKFSLDEYKKSLEDTIEFIKSFGSTGLGITSDILTGPMASKGLPERASFENGQLKMQTSTGISAAMQPLVGRVSLPTSEEMFSAIQAKDTRERLQFLQAEVQEGLDSLNETITSSMEGMVRSSLGGLGGIAEKQINEIVARFNQLPEGIQAMKLKMATMLSMAADTLGKGFEAFGEALATGKNPFAAFGKAMLKSLGEILSMIGRQMLQRAAILFALGPVTSGFSTGYAAKMALGGAALITAGSAISSVKLAKGGLAYGPTLATVGDNIGASYDPEVVSPLSKLREYMGGGQTIRIQGEISNDTIRLSNERGTQTRQSLRGRG